MNMQILSWFCLIMCAQAIAFMACHSTKGEVATDMNLKPSDHRDDEQYTRGVEAVVIRDRRGGFGGSDLMRKPSKTKNGAAKTLGAVNFCVFMVINCFFLLI